MQYDPPEEFSQERWFAKLKCACGMHTDCPEYERPEAEVTVNNAIKYYSYKTYPTCSKCGTLPDGTKACPLCSAKKNEKKKGVLKLKVHYVIEEKPFQEFWIG